MGRPRKEHPEIVEDNMPIENTPIEHEEIPFEDILDTPIPEELPEPEDLPKVESPDDLVLCKANVSQTYHIALNVGRTQTVFTFSEPDFTCKIPRKFAEIYNAIPKHPVKLWSE